MSVYQCFIFFTAPATTEIYTYVHTLSLHDALPIYVLKEALENNVKKIAELELKVRLTQEDARQSLAALERKLTAATQSEAAAQANAARSEEHTSELQSLMRISYAVFCLKKKKTTPQATYQQTINILLRSNHI